MLYDGKEANETLTRDKENRKRMYMSYRSYTCCRSYNFGKIFAEVTTSTDDIVEVITSAIILAEV
jgi:2-hydroxy-3-keto-5-methylthiopentenyl-1-phosphate phosphatase